MAEVFDETGAGMGAMELAGSRVQHASGGVSEVYGGGMLNLGLTAEDRVEAVMENRRRVVEAAGGGWGLVLVHQVHGVEVMDVVAGAMEGGGGRGEADGMVTGEPGLLLGVGAADCAPLLVADVRQRVVGAFHAGWRGTVAGMAGQGLRRMAELYGTRAEECVAAVGPSIGACCYEVDSAVRDGLLAGPAAKDGEAVLRAGEAAGRWRLDLWEANRRQLVRAGVPAEAITVVGECTACTREADGRRRYFSHRAEGGRTGRMLGVIGVRRPASDVLEA